jgi:uncharacterized glyoxalase superfamily protein PhnB
VKRLTPVLACDAVDPCARFWERLGFTRTAEVPHDGTLGFVILALGDVEVMYQSVASIRADNPRSADAMRVGGAALFCEVADLDAAIAAVAGAPEVVARRTTFYGMDEYGVLDPAGNVVMLARPTG